MFASKLWKPFKGSTILIFLGLVMMEAAHFGGSAPDTEERLAFVESGYMMAGYISTVRNVDLEQYPIGQ